MIYIRNGSKPGKRDAEAGTGLSGSLRGRRGFPLPPGTSGRKRRCSQEGIRRIDAFLEESVRDGMCEYDGIFASSDVHAVVILKKLRELGVRVPQQVQLIGYDGLRVLNVGDYAVSSIAQPVREDGDVLCGRPAEAD